jgi:hypothetical protein
MSTRSQHTRAERWAAFSARVEELGGTVIEPDWLGANKPHRVRCQAGHACTPRPGHVSRGTGVCRTCAGQDPAEAEAAHRARVIALGGTPLWDKWLGMGTPHQVRCAAGHTRSPRPTSIQQGGRLCRVCAGQDPVVAEAAFRARVIALGGTPLWTDWQGANHPYPVRCPAGHTSHPRPGNVRRGEGLCAACRGKTWDVFYVISGTDAATGLATVKFGITSGDPKARLANHRRNGLVTQHAVWTALPQARELESHLIRELPSLGWTPTRPRSREYYLFAALPEVVSLARELRAELGELTT